MSTKHIPLIPAKAITKRYYSIGEIEKMLGLSQSLIRYWEGEFELLKPSKNRRGDRQFTEKDIRVLEAIHELVKTKGYTIEGAKKVLKEELTDRQSRLEAIRKLEKVRAELIKLKGRL